MIKLFGKKDTVFNSNGIMVINPISLIETKESSLNGWFINAVVPIKYNDDLEEGLLAYIDTKSKGGQPFVINNIKRTDKHIEFTANHIVFDSINYILKDVRPTSMSAVGALTYVNERTDITSPYTMTSNVSNSQTAYFINRTLLEALDTIQERWGGVYDVDKFNINLKNSVGVDRGYNIMYGKNLEGVRVFEDWSNVVTKLCPVGFDGLTLPESYLFSAIDYGKPFSKVIKFETELEDEERTEAKLIAELRLNAQAYLDENQYPKLSYEVESNVSQELNIGDKVEVKHPVVSIDAEVISYEYNILTKRTTKLIFGNYKRDVKKKIGEVKKAIEEVMNKTSGLEQILVDQSDLINSLNKFGHVYIDNNQIMILDSLPKETAVNVWRWNLGGLAYSETGMEGPYKQAWTMDGKFNTDFIGANTITTNQLRSDVGSSLDISSNDSINLLVEQLGSVNTNANLIPGLSVATLDLTGWTFDGGELLAYDEVLAWDELTSSTNFIPLASNKGLSGSSLFFFSNGDAISAKGYVVPDDIHSFKVKRAVGTQNFTVIVQEFSSFDGAVTKSTSFTMTNSINEFSLSLLAGTSFVRLVFRMSSVNTTNVLQLYDPMFNRGLPADWKESALDVSIFAKAQLQILNNSLQSTVNEVVIVNQELFIQNTRISQLSDELDFKVDVNGIVAALNLSSEGVKIKGQLIALEGAVSVNGNIEFRQNGTLKAINAEFVNAKITGNLEAGTVGNWVVAGDIKSQNNKMTLKGDTGVILFQGVELSPISNSSLQGLRIKDNTGSSGGVFFDVAGRNNQTSYFMAGDPLNVLRLGQDISYGFRGLHLMADYGEYGIYQDLQVYVGNAQTRGLYGIRGEFLSTPKILIGGTMRTLSRDANGFLKAT